ncbi:MAG: hypothetical protein EOO89_24215 [Pedobacter sp.]|nr:MAG: hypothetical protein EOO89_24215 [Pedobacter sp.]
MKNILHRLNFFLMILPAIFFLSCKKESDKAEVNSLGARSSSVQGPAPHISHCQHAGTRYTLLGLQMVPYELELVLLFCGRVFQYVTASRWVSSTSYADDLTGMID